MLSDSNMPNDKLFALSNHLNIAQFKRLVKGDAKICKCIQNIIGCMLLLFVNRQF